VLRCDVELTLLVGDEMLSTSNDTGVLDTLDGLGHTNTGKDGIRREALPVTSSLRSAADGTGDRSENDVDALALVLLAHRLAALVHNRLVKGGGSGLA
jgi:hypothetical protein